MDIDVVSIVCVEILDHFIHLPKIKGSFSEGVITAKRQQNLVTSRELAQRINVVYQTNHFVVSVRRVATFNLLVKQIRWIIFHISIEAKWPAVSVISRRNN